MRDALTLGAQYANGQTTFRVWAPDHQSVDVVGAGFSRPMIGEDNGYWTAVLDVPPGTLYRYRLDGSDDHVYPDPASRFQPDGVHGPSQVVDPAAFTWTTIDWNPPSPRDLVFYELHVGTFTPEGTFNGVRERLPYLRDLGITAIEIMPVADFPGRWNWGYDGVCLFAPSRAYGTPDDLRALVDAAHAHGLAVFLDVVYNHLGPDGAYANAFSPYYFTDRHRSPWGRGVNLDGPHSAEVRRFFIENAIHWAREYRIDGLRLDATHALVDEGPRHFLEELTTEVRKATTRPVLFVAEDERDLREQLRPAAQGGWGLNGVWADDFHHDVRVHVAGDRDGYFAKYGGATANIADRINDGLPGFVFCIQNHDQVGNRAAGDRLHHAIDAAVYRAASALLLLAPETPLLFMGQEWAAGTPFQFFTDHHPELGRKVTEGRREEFKHFAAFAEPAARGRLPDPQAPTTFAASRLRWDEPATPPHGAMLRLYRALLRLRRELPLDTLVARAYDEETIVLAGGGHVVIVRLGGAGDCRMERIGRALFSTEDPGLADDPQPIDVSEGRVRFARAGAVVATGAPFAPWRGVTARLFASDTGDTGMAMQTIEELFEHELQDIYSAETSILDALEQMAGESSDRDIKRGFIQHRKETQAQIKRLEKVYKSLGQKPEASTCPGIEGLIKEKKVFMRERPSPELLEFYNIGAAQKTERYEITAYENLIDMADKLGYSEAVELLEQNLQEEEVTLNRLKAIASEFDVAEEPDEALDEA